MLSQEKILSTLSNRFLELIILPTEQCNFRCVYCYEDFSIGKMKKNIVEAIKKLISQRASSLDRLKISWFGGEPLAASDIVYELSDFILTLSELYPSLYYTGAMTTNGFLLKESTLRKLIGLGVTQFQVSLDGTEETHNKTRKRLNGDNTFQTIWNNLLTAKKTQLDFTIVLRLHITPENVEDIFTLVEKIKAEFGHDKRFAIFFKAIENLGGPQAGNFKVLRGKDKAAILEELYQSLEDVISVKKINDDGPYVCYAAQTNSFVIRANGKIGKCTVAFSDDRNSLGNLRDDGSVEVSSEKLALWTRGLKSQNEDELRCPMYRLPNLNSKLKTIPITVK